GPPIFGLAIRVRLTGISTIMCSNACGFIYIAAVSAPTGCRKASVYTRICRSLGCVPWSHPAALVACLHESRMREIFMSGSARGASVFRCAYSTDILLVSRPPLLCEEGNVHAQ